VPGGNGGTLTIAFVAVTTVRPCSPIPTLAGSTVTEFCPAVMDVNAFRLPGLTSVMVSEGVHTPGFGVGVAVGVGDAVGVAVGVGVAVAVGEGVIVGVTVAVGVGLTVGVGDGVAEPITSIFATNASKTELTFP
jgi:hypothetical protein